MSLGKVPWVMHAKHGGIQATLRVATTQHHPTTNPILTNPHTYQGHMMKTKKGEGSGSKTALNYGKQGRQTANKNKAATQ